MGVSGRFLLQEISLTQGCNPHLLICQADFFLPLIHPGSPEGPLRTTLHFFMPHFGYRATGAFLKVISYLYIRLEGARRHTQGLCIITSCFVVLPQNNPDALKQLHCG